MRKEFFEMKKKLLWIVSMLLIVAMSLTLVSCSEAPTKDDDDDKKEVESKVQLEDVIEGEWVWNIEVEDIFDIAKKSQPSAAESLAVFEEIDLSDVEFKVSYIFDDGKATIRIDEDDVKDMAQDLYDAIVKDGEKFLEYVAEAANTDLDTLIAQSGMTMDELLQNVMSSLNVEDLAESMVDSMGKVDTVELNYTIEDDTIEFPDGETWEVKVDDDKLTITSLKAGSSAGSMSEMMEDLAPIVLEKE